MQQPQKMYSSSTRQKNQEGRRVYAGNQIGQIVRQMGGGDKGAEELARNDDGKYPGLHTGGVPHIPQNSLQGHPLGKGVDGYSHCAEGSAHGGGKPAGKGAADDQAEQAEDGDEQRQGFQLGQDGYLGPAPGECSP